MSLAQPLSTLLKACQKFRLSCSALLPILLGTPRRHQITDYVARTGSLAAGGLLVVIPGDLLAFPAWAASNNWRRLRLCGCVADTLRSGGRRSSRHPAPEHPLATYSPKIVVRICRPSVASEYRAAVLGKTAYRHGKRRVIPTGARIVIRFLGRTGKSFAASASRLARNWAGCSQKPPSMAVPAHDGETCICQKFDTDQNRWLRLTVKLLLYYDACKRE